MPNTNQSCRGVTVKDVILINDKCTRRVAYFALRALAVKANASSVAPPDTWIAVAPPSRLPGAPGSTTSRRFNIVSPLAVGRQRAFATPR